MDSSLLLFFLKKSGVKTADVGSSLFGDLLNGQAFETGAVFNE
jgi:hypothetical protein